MTGWRFQFRPVLTICAALALAVLVSLGNWQLDRRAWKLDLINQVETRMAQSPAPLSALLDKRDRGQDVEYAPVFVEGRYLPEKEERLFGTYDGEAGVYVFAPFQTDDGPIVYVNRGFVPQARAQANDFSVTDARSVQIAGLLREPETLRPPASWFRSAEKSADGFWFVRAPSAMAAAAEIENAAPVYIDQLTDEATYWPRGGTTRLDFHNRHLEYALTWFGLAGALVAIWFAASLKRR